jgi:hypothetical protein
MEEMERDKELEFLQQSIPVFKTFSKEERYRIATYFVSIHNFMCVCETKKKELKLKRERKKKIIQSDHMARLITNNLSEYYNEVYGGLQ